MESYNNLTDLRRAEQSTEAEEQFQSMSRGNINPATHHLDDHGNIILPNQIGGSSLHEPRIMRSSSPASRSSESKKNNSNFGGEADDKDHDDNDDDDNDDNDDDGDNDDDDDDDNDDDDDDDDKANNDSYRSKNQDEQGETYLTGDTSNEKGLISRFSF